MFRKALVLTICVLAWGIVGSSGYPQTSLGGISGRITDTAGAIVPGVMITAIHGWNGKGVFSLLIGR